MADQIVPLSCQPNQSLTVSLDIDVAPVTLQLYVSYNEIAEYWTMDIADATGNPLVGSIPLTCAGWPAGNLLAPWAFLKIGAACMVNASGVPTDYPDDTNLGTDFLLVWSDTPSI